MGNCLHCMAHEAKRTKDTKSMKKFMKPKVDRIAASSLEKKNTVPVPVPEKGEKGAIRVKIVLTKKEATQLLSQCNGDEDMMKMLLSELEIEKMKTLKSIISSANTVNSSSSSSMKPQQYGGDAWKPVLQSIPETCCVLMF
ncbi:hypothetical protein IHE45_05G113100 [Dioscorea alata]|uniref:Uncharacterized protein n=1 Tax=Dioscorea alata TaxID=55571 RepID=A0ACB7W4I5_DIOAL|nr:hypothetical protein IHE45_05G113100 [Dioscorea alata]